MKTKPETPLKKAIKIVTDAPKYTPAAGGIHQTESRVVKKLIDLGVLIPNKSDRK